MTHADLPCYGDDVALRVGSRRVAPCQQVDTVVRVTQALWVVGVIAVATAAGLAAVSQLGSIVALSFAGIALALWKPRTTLLAVIPVAMWPAGEISGIPVGYAAVALVSVSVLLRHLPRWSGLGLPGAIIVLLVALMITSFVVNPQTRIVTPIEARNHLIATVLGFLLILATAIVNPDRRAALRIVALSGMASSGYLIATGTATAGRLSAEELNENGVGHVGAIALVCAIALLMESGHTRWLVVSVLPALLVLLSQSRGAVLIVAVGLFVLWSVGRSSRTKILASAFAPFAIVLAWPLIGAAIELLFSRRTLRYASTTDRVDLLQLAAETVIQYPILGIGWRRFPEESLAQLGTALNTHNEYARLAAESGAIALALFLLLVIVALRGTPVEGDVKATMIAALTAFALANTMSELDVSTPSWVLLGLLVAARASARTVRFASQNSHRPHGHERNGASSQLGKPAIGGSSGRVRAGTPQVTSISGTKSDR